VRQKFLQKVVESDKIQTILTKILTNEVFKNLSKRYERKDKTARWEG